MKYRKNNFWVWFGFFITYSLVFLAFVAGAATIPPTGKTNPQTPDISVEENTPSFQPGPTQNQAPTVSSVTANPTSLTLPSGGGSVSTSLSAAAIDDGRPSSALFYRWEKTSGPGAVSSVIFNNPAQINTTASFTLAGTYTLRLTVTDSGGLSGSGQVLIDVGEPNPCAGNQPPVAIIAGPEQQTGQVGTPITFDGGQSFDPNNQITSYLWDFGDGQSSGWQPSPTLPHSYSTQGSYAATLRVKDSCGVESVNPDSVSVTIQPVGGGFPPSAVATVLPTQGNTNTLFTFSGASSTDTDGTITAFQWSFGDGQTATGPTVTHTYSASSTYQIVLTVIDNNNLTDEAFLTVPVIINQPPQVSVVATPVTVIFPTNQTSLDGTVVDSDGPGPLTTTWEQVEGPDSAVITSPGSVDTTVSFIESGVYRFQLTASDGELTTQASLYVLVAPSPLTVLRDVPPAVSKGGSFVISVHLIGPVNYHLIEEGFPNVFTITNQGSFVTSPAQKLKRSYLGEGGDLTLTYTLRAPQEVGVYNLSGLFQLPGMSQAATVLGDTEVNVIESMSSPGGGGIKNVIRSSLRFLLR